MTEEKNRMFNSQKPKPLQEMEAVKTTIVGGRPAGSGKNLPPIPRGIEVLVKKASVDKEFRELLIKERNKAAQSIGLDLNRFEQDIICSVPEEQLIAIIDSVKVSPKMKSIFLGKAAGVMLAALGVTTLTGCPDKSPPVEGIRPDIPFPRTTQTEATTNEQKPISPTNNTSDTVKPQPPPTRPPIPAPGGIMSDVPNPKQRDDK